MAKHIFGAAAVLVLLSILPVQSEFVQVSLVGCLQSSTHDNAYCDRAIDGNTNQNYGQKSCTHTIGGPINWWRARTAKLTRFRQVRIFNRMECCSQWLNHFTISIDGAPCYTHQSNQPFSVKTFECDRVGQVIQIDSHLTGGMNLCEVQVFGEEIALQNPGKQLTLTKCQQSSTTHDGVCDRALDGNTNQHYSGLSCTHTDAEPGWWQASTERISLITHVRIYNRLDCCSEALNDFSISVDSQECESYQGTGYVSLKTFKCNRMGQIVRITNRRKIPLMLCEVQVFGNPVESQKLPLTHCSQSSTIADGNCHRAIDGNRNQMWSAASCTATGSEKGWWRAVTLKLSRFSHIRIYNRQDCCPERLSDITIAVDGIVCATYHSTVAFSVMTFECNKVGQVLTVASHKAEPLTMCEIEAYGETVELPTVGQKLLLSHCSQSSMIADGVCQKAIDGNRNQHYGGGSCTATNERQRGWWQARTLKLSHFRQVRIYNRFDCCSERLSDFAITVDGSVCATYSSTAFFSMQTFECDKVGQVLAVVSHKMEPLTMCEIEAFGETIELPTPERQLRLQSCSQSSTILGASCERAIDGITSQHWNENSCTATAEEKGWWQARTSKTAFITHVRIYNRLDCCQERISDISISVGGQECAAYKSDTYFTVKTFECNVVGQVIRIESHKKTVLTLCEVEVFGQDEPR